MNAETLKRLVRAISDGSRDDLDRLARKIIQGKRESGQIRLANELEALLNQDTSLFRRFDEVFQFPLPGVVEIERLMQMTLSAVKVAPQIDWAKPAETFVGRSAAQIVKVAQNAAKSVVLANQKSVEEQHLREARLGSTSTIPNILNCKL